MSRRFCMTALSLAAALFTFAAQAVNIQPTGAVAGEWSADWAAVRALAKANNTFYLIDFGKTSGCAYCNALQTSVYDKPEFTAWAKANGIPLLYANRVDTSTEPGVSVKQTYSGLADYPEVLIIDGNGTGYREIGRFLYRIFLTYNGITIRLTVADFIAIVDSFTKTLVTNDAWDSTATLAGDEVWTNAVKLAAATTNRLHGVHTLKNADTNDWFAFTNVVAGGRYRVAVTNLTVANAAPQLSLYADAASAGADNAWTNVTLAAATTGLFFEAQSAGTVYARAWRPASSNANVSYTLTYRNATIVPHALTVVNGSGTVTNAVEGQACPVAANAPGAGQFFASWAVVPAGAALGAGFHATQSVATVTMPAFDVTLTAQYQAETRVLALAGSLAFGNVMTNRTAQRSLTVSNTGNRALEVTDIQTPAGFTAATNRLTLAPGASRSVAFTFAPTKIQAYTGVVTFVSDKTAGPDGVACSGAGVDNTPPQFTARSPLANPAAITEGAALAFSATANDLADGDVAGRGMVSVAWLVNGVEQAVSTGGAPAQVSSAFTFRTTTNTVSGVASNQFTVTAVALDRQGGRTETTWSVWVYNARAAQAIIFPALPVKGLGDPDFAPGAVATSGLTVQYTSSNESVARIDGGLIHLLAAGTAVITAAQPGDADFRPAASISRALTVRVRVAATADPVAGGTVTGGGTYPAGARVTLVARPAAGYTFLRWEDGSQIATRTLVVGGAPVNATAFFGLTAGVQPPVLGNPGAQRGMVGVQFALPLALTSDSLPTVRAYNLPSGLRYDSVSNALLGVPVVAVTNKTVTLTAKNVNPAVVTQQFDIAVESLPAWAQGTFNGWCEHAALGRGSASLTVSPLGRITGKLQLAGTNYTINASAFAALDEEGSLWISCQAVAGRASLPLTFKLYGLVHAAAPQNVVADPFVPALLSLVEGWFGDSRPDSHDAHLCRDVWKDQGLSTVITNYAGYYTATLPVAAESAAPPAAGPEYGAAVDTPAGSAYLTLTVDKSGAVKAVGRLADGTAVSMSSVLIVDEAGRIWTVLYTAPATYKGGGFFGLVEFVKTAEGPVALRLLDGVTFDWWTLNPFATGDYDAGGFARTLRLSGGWYDKVGNLYAYYAGKALSVGVGETAATPVFNVSTGRYESVCWNPDGLSLSVATNALGVMTGIKAPAAGAPVYSGGAWTYGAENAMGLSLTLVRATGLFSGTFKAWYDYGTVHTYRLLSVLGAITPVRELPGDGAEGRGFFLSADKAFYLNPAKQTVPYMFNESFDFVIESAPQN